tara:strand:- start:445 stop:936 length:492 start_codon:yes stop_codon:yes gene_type:complete
MYVESKVALNLPKSRILNLIREPGSLNKYHPFCKRNDAIKWPGTNSIDELEYLNGSTFERNFFNWHENGYDLIIERKNKSKMAQVNWIIEGNDEISSLRVRINPVIGHFTPFKNKFMQILSWYLFVKPMLQSYINKVIKGFEFFANTDMEVKPNQFGKHSWFS